LKEVRMGRKCGRFARTDDMHSFQIIARAEATKFAVVSVLRLRQSGMIRFRSAVTALLHARRVSRRLVRPAG